MRFNSFVSVILYSILYFSDCSQAQKPVQQIPYPQPQTISVLAWNLNKFGPKKGENHSLLQDYAGILTNYDISFLQEITDVTGVSERRLGSFMHGFNKKISSRSGKTNNKEQYLVYYRNCQSIQLLTFKDFNPDKEERWERPPVYLEFQLGKNIYQFFCLHSRPTDVGRELRNLEMICTNKGNLIVFGDLNFPKKIRDREKIFQENTFQRWKFLIPDNADTTVSESTKLTLDRIIVNESANQKVVRSEVIRKKENTQITIEMSDHYPVALEISTK